jgi:hypothetical protein
MNLRFLLEVCYIKNNGKLLKCVREFRLTFLFSFKCTPHTPEIEINILFTVPILLCLNFPTPMKAWCCLIFASYTRPTNPSSPSARSIMQLDSRVKVIALSFLSVLVDTRLRQRLRAGRMEEGTRRLLRGTAPVMQGFILNVPRGGERPKEKHRFPANKWTNSSHRPVKQQHHFRARMWGC